MQTQTELTTTVKEPIELRGETIEKLALAGDVGGLTRDEKINYYRSLCDRVGLDAATQPFKLLKLNGKEVFYCDRSGTQQLSRLHGVSHEVKAREIINGCYVVTARAFQANGRATESIGAVPVEHLKGEALCNAYMKAETKAKRRATLDLLGLGMLDESEVDSIPNAQRIETPVARLAVPEAETPAQPVPTPQIASQGPKTYVLKAVPDPVEKEPSFSAYKSRFLQRVAEAGYEIQAWDWATSTGAITMKQRLVELPAEKAPRSKKAFDELMDNFKVNKELGVTQELAENYDAAHLDDQLPGAEIPTQLGDMDLPWRDIIIPIPRKGQKRDDYLKNPDTIGSLYDAVHDDEEARSRLWWLVEKWEPTTTWTGKDGKERQRREDEVAIDRKVRDALDQFKLWHDAKKAGVLEEVTP